MSKKKKTTKQGSGRAEEGAFKVLTAVLAVALVVMIIITVVKINTSYSDYTSTPNDILRSVNNGYYPDALMEMYDNIALGKTAEKDDGYRAPYALLNYYEAESCFSGYTKAADQAAAAGDKEYEEALRMKASEYQAEMEAARSGMGELDFMTEDIDELFS